MMKYLMLGLILALNANAGNNLLRDRIAQSLTQAVESEQRLELDAYLALQAKGVENCQNKCDKSFNKFAYLITINGQPSYEFQACVAGCNQCAKDLANHAPADNCFKFCKNKDWKTDGLVKGVIEPDKACLGGCIVNTCQVICSNGTPADFTPATKNLYWPNGGCSIKTQPYSQNFEYVPWNSPNTGQGGTEDVAQCCANALSLCGYVGDQTSQNFATLLDKTGQFCDRFVPSRAQADICTFFNNPQNCGDLNAPPGGA